jgi:hypothetical protein
MRPAPINANPPLTEAMIAKKQKNERNLSTVNRGERAAPSASIRYNDP